MSGGGRSWAASCTKCDLTEHVLCYWASLHPKNSLASSQAERLEARASAQRRASHAEDTLQRVRSAPSCEVTVSLEQLVRRQGPPPEATSRVRSEIHVKRPKSPVGARQHALRPAAVRARSGGQYAS